MLSSAAEEGENVLNSIAEEGEECAWVSRGRWGKRLLSSVGKQGEKCAQFIHPMFPC